MTDTRTDLPAGACWQPDPAGRHALRWWDGTGWSREVVDDGHQSTDPDPPPAPASNRRVPRTPGPGTGPRWSARAMPTRRRRGHVLLWAKAAISLGVAGFLVGGAVFGLQLYRQVFDHALSDSGRQLLRESDYYLDADAALPGFSEFDLDSFGFDVDEFKGGPLGDHLADPEAYQSTAPLEVVVLVMGVASSGTDKDDAHSALGDRESIERAFSDGFAQGSGGGEIGEFAWSTPAVGSEARLGRVTSAVGAAELDIELLVFLQEKGDDLVVMMVAAAGDSGGSLPVDALTIGEYLSQRLAGE